MEEATETNGVQEEYQKAKAEGKQPLCPYCKAPLQIGQNEGLSNYWRWNDETKKYERYESDPEADEPFCIECETSDWDFLENDLVLF